MRVPAYCDRILFRSSTVTENSLKRLECKISDHRPVFATFMMSAKTVQHDAYTRVEREAMDLITSQLQEYSSRCKEEWVVPAMSLPLDEARHILSQVNWDVSKLYQTTE